MQVLVIFALAVGLPLAWLVSEFQPYRWLRILLGLLSLSMGVFLAFAFSILERFNYNAWYGTSSADLIDTVANEIEEGRTESLLPRLKQLRADFHPTYENKARYDELVEKFVKDLKSEHESFGNP